MQIVIDISDERFRDIQRIAEVQTERKHFKTAEQIIANGTPLPIGHGRLIDADAFINFLKNTSKTQKYNEFIIDKELTGLTIDDVFNAVCESLQNEGLAEGNSSTIIPADTESEVEE